LRWSLPGLRSCLDGCNFGCSSIVDNTGHIATRSDLVLYDKQMGILDYLASGERFAGAMISDWVLKIGDLGTLSLHHLPELVQRLPQRIS
jgi:hypothetical protein